MTTKLPSRADHVGSFLRPRSVIEARAHRGADNISYEQLRATEDEAIADLVKWQESLGLKAVTDGEFRRYFFHTDFLLQLSGVEEHGGIAKAFKNDSGTDVHFAPPKMVISGKIEHVKPIQRADYEFLAKHVTQTSKVAIPSPTMLHFRAGRAGIPEDVYPTMDEFYADVAQAYREEVEDLAAAGCRYIQMDDTNLAYLCDDSHRADAAARGVDPNDTPRPARAEVAAAVREADQRELQDRPRRHDQGDPLVPRQLPLELGGRRRLRAGCRDHVQRTRYRRLLP
jgi:5-methyltetrahydropteroyltriglutamate--homocysteine methyltransferase